MIHPDYQYTPKLIPAMVSIIANGLHPCVLGSRILGGYALQGRHAAVEVYVQPVSHLCREHSARGQASEYHTGYRAFSREILSSCIWQQNSDDFVFDNQMLAQILWHGFTIGEVSCPTKYFPEASSINFRTQRSVWLGCLSNWAKVPTGKMGVVEVAAFSRATACRSSPPTFERNENPTKKHRWPGKEV